jgi:hypothetical protein
MSIFRTDKQVAFTDLLVAVEETVEDYIDLAKVLGDSPSAAQFLTFANERIPLIESLEAELRLLGDLPSVPNADKEDVGKLVHRIRAAFSSDALHPALKELIGDEEHSLQLAKICEQKELNEAERKLVMDLVQQIDQTLARLHRMAAEPAPDR